MCQEENVIHANTKSEKWQNLRDDRVCQAREVQSQ